MEEDGETRLGVPDAEEIGKETEPSGEVNGTQQDEVGRVKCEVNGLLIMNENNKKADQMEDGVEIERRPVGKGDGDSEEEDCVPPALPPRPPPRSRPPTSCNCSSSEFGLGEGEFQQSFQRSPSRSCWASGLRKYVFLCTACGSLSILLGTLFLTVYFMLKSYTSSLNHFETIPTYVPSGMLIATGFLIICLACRKNRNSFLMKLCGLCSLCCAVLCVSVTVTTTVIHMNRLQTLRECLYTQKTQSCTCYSVLMDNDRTSDEGIKFVFNSTPDCEVVHGALYSCLRAIFGLSVIGILVCIFSCMLVYQLLSHEKKKMYWAQLEMRCRYLYRQQRNPHYCSCCDECRYPPPPHEIFPWELMGNRFWSSGRIGNLYTPNPEDRDGSNRLRSAWNWRRLPWNRNGSSGNEPSRANLGSPDSQYGFSSTPTVDGAPYTVLDPRTANCPSSIPPGTDITEGGFYSWGPPPPYASNRNSANNSPARRSIGEILHQVSPIRRNDNVSPIRPYHHVHHHHMHHPHSVNHQCTSSGRQVPTATQSNCLQKSTPSRAVQVSDALQHQRSGIENNLRSNSLTSVHHFQKIEQNKDNYENTYESESFPATNGFNTLPSLKKRNQTRASDLFQNETTSGYYFSSAENLGCAESNTGNDGQFPNESLPPRVFLLNDAPRTTRYQSDGNGYPKASTGDAEHPPEQHSGSRMTEGSSSPQGMNRGIRTGENSFVKKLFVSCSPTKQKHRSDGEPLPGGEKREPSVQVNKKKPGKRLAASKDADGSNENVITFHYRLGIPRSPNIQNFGQFTEKSGKEGKEESDGNEEEPQENAKVLKGIKYVSKDVEMLQKHGSLMKEFNKNVDLQKNLKYKSEKSPGRSGYENKAFQGSEDCPRGSFPRSVHPEYSGGKAARLEFQGEEQGKNENESDVYFGDISNSSCYVSVQNEGGDSSLYEEAVEHRSVPATSYPGNGQSLLNKQNLKRIDDENAGFGDLGYDHGDNQENPTYSKLQGEVEGYPQNYRNRRSGQFRFAETSGEAKKDESRGGQENFGKAPRRSYLVAHNYNEMDNKGKYYPTSGCYPDHYRSGEHYQEANNSNDEHSSSSLTADSGISTGRNYHPRCYDATYQEIDCGGGKENAESRTDACFETLNERFSSMEKFQSCKIPGLENLSDFSHPLFQKPKVVPRGNRYKEGEVRQKKGKSDYEKDGEDESRKMRSFGGSSKSKEPGEGQSDERLVPEDGYQKQKAEEPVGKSPKPLPRTSVVPQHESGSHSKHGKYSQREKHFLAPDAQYDYKDSFKPQKSQGKKDGKPVVPARPLNLQERCRNSNFILRDGYCKTEGGCPPSRRRLQQQTQSQQQQPQHGHNDSEDKDNNEIGNHSVNV